MLVAACLRCYRLENSKLLIALSGMSYQFFLVQLFLWKMTAYILGIMGLTGNKAKIILSFLLCTGVSFMIWKFYDKPVRRILIRKMLR